MKIGIQGLETLWNELDLSITPKMHILLKHTIAQDIQFGGIWDKVEDFIKKSHQDGKNALFGHLDEEPLFLPTRAGEITPQVAVK